MILLQKSEFTQELVCVSHVCNGSLQASTHSQVNKWVWAAYTVGVHVYGLYVGLCDRLSCPEYTPPITQWQLPQGPAQGQAVSKMNGWLFVTSTSVLKVFMLQNRNEPCTVIFNIKA